MTTQAFVYPFSLLELIRNYIIFFIAPKIVKKAITNRDSSEIFGPDFLLVVVLKNCEPELSYILAALFNICLKEPCFPDCYKVGCLCF